MASEKTQAIPTVSKVLKLAWQLTYGVKLPIFLRTLAVVIICIISNNAIEYNSNYFFEYFFGKDYGPAILILLPLLMLFIGMLDFIILLIAYVNLISLALSHVVSKKSNLHNVIRLKTDMRLIIICLLWLSILFFYIVLAILCFIFFKIFLLEIIMQIILFGLLLYFIVPIAIFSIPLILVKQYNVTEALVMGNRLADKCWMPLMGSIICLMIALIISAIPLGIGFFWTIPMIYTLTAAWFTSMTDSKISDLA